MKRETERLLWLPVIVFFWLVILGYIGEIQASGTQHIATDQTTKILDMIGPHGLFAIIGTIFFMRFIASLTYFGKAVLFVLTLGVAGVFGGLSVYYTMEAPSPKQIQAGAFITAVASPVAYELSKLGLRAMIALNYGKPLEEVFIAAYWFLSPKPIELKQKGNKQKLTIQPHKGLTDATQFTRVDKRVKHKKVDFDVTSHEDGTIFSVPDCRFRYCPTQELCRQQGCISKLDLDKTPTPKSPK